MSIAECGDKPTLIDEIWLMLMLMLICCERKNCSFAEKYYWSIAEEQAKVFVIITLDVDRSLLLYAWWMKSVTELIEKECLLLILNTVTSLWCWWGVALYVPTTIWYVFVIASIVIVEIHTFIMQHQLTNFVMLVSIVIVKCKLCVQ